MSFLPANYTKVPKTGGSYLNKFEEGETKIRILSPAITGYEYWTHEDKPVRLKEAPSEMPSDLRPGKFGKDINHFWAMIVWNFKEAKIQIMQINQSTIQEGILDYHMDPEWGDPMEYNITIVKTIKNDFTKYTVKATPPSELPVEAAQAFSEQNIDLTALYRGEDPFEGKQSDEPTPDEPQENIDIEDIKV